MCDNSGEMLLNIGFIPSDGCKKQKNKISAKQRKINYEMRREKVAARLLKQSEWHKEAEARKNAREEAIAKRSKQKEVKKKSSAKNDEDDEFVNFVLKGEVTPKVFPSEGKLVFPNLSLQKSQKLQENNVDRNGKRKGRRAKQKKSGLFSEKDIGKSKEENTTQTSPENGNEFIQFVKKPQKTDQDSGKTSARQAQGKFLRKSKKASQEEKAVKFAFGDFSDKPPQNTINEDFSEKKVDKTKKRSIREEMYDKGANQPKEKSRNEIENTVPTTETDNAEQVLNKTKRKTPGKSKQKLQNDSVDASEHKAPEEIPLKKKTRDPDVSINAKKTHINKNKRPEESHERHGETNEATEGNDEDALEDKGYDRKIRKPSGSKRDEEGKKKNYGEKRKKLEESHDLHGKASDATEEGEDAWEENGYERERRPSGGRRDELGKKKTYGEKWKQPEDSRDHHGETNGAMEEGKDEWELKDYEMERRRPSGGRRDEDASDGRSGQFSLFGCNPDIPSVPMRVVRPVHEQVFSELPFNEMQIHPFLVSRLKELGMETATTVQRLATPQLLAGRDALVRSQTGSGKTLAYALAVVELLQRQRPPLTRADGVRALVVLPSRELALQTYNCFLQIVKPFLRLVPGCLVGGEKRKSEKARLRKGITILVGTPGRVIDHLKHTRSLRLNKLQFLVLDEADLLHDMGYERDVSSIVAEIDSQTKPLLSKAILEWNRSTYEIDAANEKAKGYLYQDSGAEDSQTKPLLSKAVLEWNRSTYKFDAANEKAKGYLSQDSGAEVEEEEKVTGEETDDSSDLSSEDCDDDDNDDDDEEEEEKKDVKENVKTKKESEATKSKKEPKESIREVDETSDYDPEERADELMDEEEVEGAFDSESEEEEDDEDSYEYQNVETANVDEGKQKLRQEVQRDLGEKKERHWQTVLLSATLTPAVERLAGLALNNPVYVDAAEDDHRGAPGRSAAAVPATTRGDAVTIPDSLQQHYIVVPAKLRLVTLSAFIVWKCKLSKERKMLLFCATQHMVDYFTELLTVGLSQKDTDEIGDSDEDEETGDFLSIGVDFFRLHGNMDQKERTHVFQTFSAAESGVLLCTDVAARGLDLPRVDWIVQWTAPCSVADYVHRVGRTARVGARGAALLFLLPTEADFLQVLQDKRISLQEEAMDKCLRKLAQAAPRVGKSMEQAATELQLRYEKAVLSRESLHSAAVNAYISYVRFYATYPREVRDVFSFKALHLGHQAKSFALRDPPTSIAGIGRRLNFHGDRGGRSRGGAHRQRARPDSRGSGYGQGRPAPAGGALLAPRKRRLVVSEFASGLDPLPKRARGRAT